MEKRLGLIGKNISYSFSKKYFTEKFEKLNLEYFSYEIYDIAQIQDVQDIFETPDLLGLNVTIPYKQQIIPYLDVLSDEAQEIGAVNTILLKDGKKIGFNTDAFGFEQTLKSKMQQPLQNALILGDGGAAKAVQYVLNKLKIPFKTVSRSGTLNFENLDKRTIADHKIIIQSTPVGTFPNVNDTLDFDFSGITDEHLVIDLIYNPAKTMFLKLAEERGATIVNGELMLHQQAEKAWKIWNQF